MGAGSVGSAGSVGLVSVGLGCVSGGTVSVSGLGVGLVAGGAVGSVFSAGVVVGIDCSPVGSFVGSVWEEVVCVDGFSEEGAGFLPQADKVSNTDSAIKKHPNFFSMAVSSFSDLSITAISPNVKNNVAVAKDGRLVYNIKKCYFAGDLPWKIILKYALLPSR